MSDILCSRCGRAIHPDDLDSGYCQACDTDQQTPSEPLPPPFQEGPRYCPHGFDLGIEDCADCALKGLVELERREVEEGRESPAHVSPAAPVSSPAVQAFAPIDDLDHAFNTLMAVVLRIRDLLGDQDHELILDLISACCLNEARSGNAWENELEWDRIPSLEDVIAEHKQKKGKHP